VVVFFIGNYSLGCLLNPLIGFEHPFAKVRVLRQIADSRSHSISDGITGNDVFGTGKWLEGTLMPEGLLPKPMVKSMSPWVTDVGYIGTFSCMNFFS
jgi:hypothetical protein